MSFEAKIPENLRYLEGQLKVAERSARDMYHHCNCDHCDKDGELKDEYTDADIEKLETSIDEVEATIERLKRFAARHHLDPRTGQTILPHPAAQPVV